MRGRRGSRQRFGNFCAAGDLEALKGGQRGGISGLPGGPAPAWTRIWAAWVQRLKDEGFMTTRDHFRLGPRFPFPSPATWTAI